MKNGVMTRIDRDTYKKLQYLKLELDLPSIAAVVASLVKEYENGKS